MHTGRIQKPGDDKPGNDKPGDDKPGDDKPGNDKLRALTAERNQTTGQSFPQKFEDVTKLTTKHPMTISKTPPPPPPTTTTLWGELWKEATITGNLIPVKWGSRVRVYPIQVQIDFFGVRVTLWRERPTVNEYAAVIA